MGNRIDVKSLKRKEAVKWLEIQKIGFSQEINEIGISEASFRKLIMITRITFGFFLYLLNPGRKYFLVRKKNSDVIISEFSVDKHSNGHFLATISVFPDHQRQGFGREIMNHFIVTYGDKKLYLTVRGDNQPARKLYESSGFKSIARIYQYSINIPLSPIEVPGNVTIRKAVKKDLERLQEIQETVPGMEALPQSYSDAFRGMRFKWVRLSFQIPAVCLVDGEIVGLGRAIWSRGTNHVQIIATAFLPQAKDIYPAFISYLSSLCPDPNRNIGTLTSTSRNEVLVTEISKLLLTSKITIRIEMEHAPKNKIIR